MEKTANLALSLLEYTDAKADLPNVWNGNAQTIDSAIGGLQDTVNTLVASGGGSGGNVISIVFEAAFAGAQYTVTDGEDTVTGTVPSGCVVTVSAANCNSVYTITSTAGGVEYSTTVTTGQYYGQYTATLAVFTATIQVATAAGAVVTAACGEVSYSATADSAGAAIVTVNKAGSYTVSATVSGASSDTATVSVTEEGGSYTATVHFIVLTVTTPAGCALTLTNGSATFSTASTTGTETFYLPGTGTWTGTITKDGESATGSVSVTAHQNYTLSLAFVHIYGASWDGTSTTAWTRTDEAAGFTDPAPYVKGASSYSSPFDNLQPWAGMVTSERTGGTMVAIPKFWYKLTQNGAGMTVQIADKETAGYSVSPTHMDRGDGKGERDVVYIGRYHCGATAYKSVSGQKPKVSITRDTARTAIHNLGSTLWQNDWATRFTIWLLYIVEFADWNSQAKIGYGCGDNSAVEAMGASDSMPYHTGTMQTSRTTYGVGTQYRNIEGLWENCLDWCDGCHYSSSGMSIILNPSNFSDSTGGTVIGTPSNGYPTAFTVKDVSGLFPAFLATTAGGSDSTYSCDSWDFGASYPCVYVGGYYSQGGIRGLFYVSYNTASHTSTNIGSRLLELP